MAKKKEAVRGKPVLIVSLPIDRIEPAPFQRDPSDPHVKRLMTVIASDRNRLATDPRRLLRYLVVVC